MLLALLAGGHGIACGQQIVSFHVPESVCAGAEARISFGEQDTHNVVIYTTRASLGHSERTFLPDGVPCGGNCSYRSTVSFEGFPEGSIIRNVEDIKYVRVNMEHSYIGDIYIKLTCPDGRKVDLMRKHSVGSNSDCAGTIAGGSIGWLTGSNVSSTTFLGNPVDDDDSRYPCDPTRYDNRAGTGWNYCWSSSQSRGYVYGAGDGIIYRSGNEVTLNGNGGYFSRKSIDSSNVAAGTQFYHPDESFSALTGCPVNGEWEIEVMDGYSVDNGYLFEWELALNEELTPISTCEVTGYEIESAGELGVWENDSTFRLTVPEVLDNDTAILYTFRVMNDCGEIVDTTAWITFHPNKSKERYVHACDSLWVEGNLVTNLLNITTHHTSAAGCDSAETLRVRIHPSYELSETEEVLENELPHNFHGHLFEKEVEDTLLRDESIHGCDSITHYTLTVHWNKERVTDTSICSDAAPMVWNGTNYSESVDDTVRMLTSEGADSILVLHLTVKATNDTTIAWETVENELPVVFGGYRFTETADTLFRGTNTKGCDSTVHFSLTVHRNHSYSHSRTICADALPYRWMGYLFSREGTQTFRERDIYGADSTVTLHLTVNPVSDSLTADTVCASLLPYPFGNQLCEKSGLYVHSFKNKYGCDSTVSLQLTVAGVGLKAAIHAKPLVVTPEQREVELYDASLGNRERRWTIGDHGCSEQRNLTITFPEEDDSLQIMLVAMEPLCSDTARVTLLIDRSRLTLPNAFTPNEATNNIWQPVGYEIEEMELWIYNRQGLLVKHLEGINPQWDGRDGDGNICPQGAYVYHLRYIPAARPLQPKNETGTILLIR